MKRNEGEIIEKTNTRGIGEEKEVIEKKKERRWEREKTTEWGSVQGGGKKSGQMRESEWEG